MMYETIGLVFAILAAIVFIPIWWTKVVPWIYDEEEGYGAAFLAFISLFGGSLLCVLVIPLWPGIIIGVPIFFLIHKIASKKYGMD